MEAPKEPFSQAIRKLGDVLIKRHQDRQASSARAS
jgi:hypothetical protein